MKLASDLLILSGVGGVGAGLYMASAPLGIIFAGLTVTGLGLLVGVRATSKERTR